MLVAPKSATSQVLSQVRERTRAHVSVALTDHDALVVAITCGMEEAHALLEYSQSRGVRADTLAHASRLRLSDDEFCALFGTPDPSSAQARHPGNAPQRLVEYESLPEAAAMRARLEAALGTTLGEGAQRGAWAANPAIRVAAQVALCRSTDARACLASVLGGMVRADERRVEDLKTSVEDAGLDIMVTAQAIAALAASVV